MSFRLVIRSSRQIAELWDGSRKLKDFQISTARNGLGSEPGSLCTPRGRHRIAQKIGEGAPFGAVFRERHLSGEVWARDPDNPLFATREDLILTRILWLDGMEPRNLNTHQRQIYLHGTNREGLLGIPDSKGGIRFRNEDILEVFAALETGDTVEIL